MPHSQNTSTPAIQYQNWKRHPSLRLNYMDKPRLDKLRTYSQELCDWYNQETRKLKQAHWSGK